MLCYAYNDLLGKSVSDDLLIAVALTCGQSLRDLNIANCHAVSSRGLAGLCKHGHQLQSLNMSFCRNIHELMLMTLIDSSIACSSPEEGLHRIVLWGCTHLSSSFFSDCAQRYPHLKLEG